MLYAILMMLVLGAVLGLGLGVADKYLKINTLDEKIIDFVYKKRGLIFNKKISGFGMDEFKIVYRLLFIPFYTIVKTKNTVKHLLFGIIKIKEARL